MYTLLRAVRLVCGFLFAMQAISAIPFIIAVFAGVQHSVADYLLILSLKLGVVAFFGLLFFGIRLLINWIHVRRTGAPYPALASKWAL